MNNKEHKSRRNKEDIPEMRSEKVATPKVSIKRKRKCEFEFLDDEVATTKYLMNEVCIGSFVLALRIRLTIQLTHCLLIVPCP